MVVDSQSCLYFVHYLALVLIREAATNNSGLFLSKKEKYTSLHINRLLACPIFIDTFGSYRPQKPFWNLFQELRNFTCLTQHKQMCGVADRKTEGQMEAGRPNDKLMTEMKNHRRSMNRASSIRQIRPGPGTAELFHSSQQVKGYR